MKLKFKKLDRYLFVDSEFLAKFRKLVTNIIVDNDTVTIHGIKNSFVFQFVYGIDDGLINPLRQFFLAYFLIYRQSLVQTLGQYAAQPIFLDFHQLNHNSTFR